MMKKCIVHHTLRPSCCAKHGWWEERRAKLRPCALRLCEDGDLASAAHMRDISPATGALRRSEDVLLKSAECFAQVGVGANPSWLKMAIMAEPSTAEGAAEQGQSAGDRPTPSPHARVRAGESKLCFVTTLRAWLCCAVSSRATQCRLAWR